jgi:hypothetical protein
VARRAEALTLSYEGSQTIIKKKSTELKNRAYSINTEKILLYPGWRLAITRISFPDKDSFEVRVNVDRDLIYSLQWYPKSRGSQQG